LIGLFGAALDALDDPERVQLKWAYIQALDSDPAISKLPVDPYDAIASIVDRESKTSTALRGRLGLPDWLTPRPQKPELSMIHASQYRDFIDNEAIAEYVEDCRIFVEQTIFPDIPCMIGADHAMAAGPIRALANRFGPEDLAVVVIDAHFDAIPPDVRAPTGMGTPYCGSENCGSFLRSLMDDSSILPEHLIIVGVADYPRDGISARYNRAYQDLIEQGVTVIPNNLTSRSIMDKLEAKLSQLGARQLYISLDADAGALRCMNAVRFLDHKGLDESTLLGLAGLLGTHTALGNYTLAGMDVSEVDVHLLGLPDTRGNIDRTAEICADFIITVIDQESDTLRTVLRRNS
jgi:arginase family enzyme